MATISTPWKLLFVVSLAVTFMRADTTDPSTTTSSSPADVPSTTLWNGIKIPLIGLGCASGVRKAHVLSALQSGYRYLDTAQSYNWGYHERDVAEAIQESPHVTRPEVFVTTKVHPENLGYESTKRAVQESLKLPGFEGYLDAVLIHKPHCWEGACSKQPEGTWQESWKALEEFYEAGLVKAIGICDVEDRILRELLQQKIKPHIIQNWFDPFHQNNPMRQRIQSHGILYQAYSTLGTQWTHFRGLKENPVLQSPELTAMAQRYHVPGPANVVLQWALAKGISVLPASKNPQRQAENLYQSYGFQLTQEDIQALDALDGKVPKPDPNRVTVTFQTTSSSTVDAFWVSGDQGKEVAIGSVAANAPLTLDSHHGHTMVFRSSQTGEQILRHVVSKTEGNKQTILVPSDEEDEEL